MLQDVWPHEGSGHAFVWRLVEIIAVPRRAERSSREHGLLHVRAAFGLVFLVHGDRVF